jgi:hypothetical protein
MTNRTQSRSKITGSRKTDFGKAKSKRTKGLRGTDKEISLAAYQTAAEKVNWQNQKEMYQQGHEFFLNYHNLYADNQTNDIGRFLDLHYSLVQNYKQKGKVSATSEAEYEDLVALVKAQIRTLERILPKVQGEQAELVSAELRTLKRIEAKNKQANS